MARFFRRLLDALLAGAIAFTVTWLVIFFVRLVGAPAALFREATGQPTSVLAAEPLRRFVEGRDRFTIAEVACLLAQTDIRQDNLVGPAAGYVHDIKKRLLAGRIKPLNDTSGEIQMANASVTMTGLTGTPPRELRNSLEISKDALAKLGLEFAVELPGIGTNKAPDRVSLVEFRSEAQRRDWKIPDQHSLDGPDLLEGLRQAGLDGTLKFWGRLNEFGDDSISRREPLREIPAAHWADYQFDWLAAMYADENFTVATYNRRIDRPMRGGYKDVHVERLGSIQWLESAAKTFRGMHKF